MKLLKRSPEQKWIAGICGGIGTTFDTDPTIVRLIFVFLALASGVVPLVLTYLFAWLIVPTTTGPSIFRSIVAKPQPGIPIGDGDRRQAASVTKTGEG